MVSELQVGAAYGASFVNVHVGSHRGLGREQGLRRLVAGISRIAQAVEAGGPLLVLETSAGSGDGIGSSIEDLADAMELAGARGVGQVGFCLDTAHLWAAGYCIDGEDGVAQLVGRIDALLGRQHVVMVHLNDSRSACGSRVDRHEHVGAGNIGAPGMRAILEHPWLATLPAYLETPGMDDGYDAINLQRVALLLAGEQLPPLPAEAFAARPGRRMRRSPVTTSAEVPLAT
jgi:deoxyribonuclease-4